ncbi:MAG: TIGR01440 family protein [Clostridia bacterium]|nr:TIGR01440 family protein [Clostridia bacterium]
MEKSLYGQARLTIEEIIEKAGLGKGSILVIGCSTSEIAGSRIGTNSAPEIAASAFAAFYECAKEKGIYLAVQCCEHLNRAVVIEREAARNFEVVNVIPQPKAGGSMATQAYATFEDPVVVEEIKADAGIDIGFTLIGMHLKKVAVPVRLENNRIGEALVIAARTRPKFIGGARAVYDETML